MFNCIKESFNLTNKYIILATPLILFSLFSGLYLLLSASGNVIGLVFAVCLFVLMLAAFLSGWFFMLKHAVVGYNEEPNSLIKLFPEGVGEYILPILGLMFNTLVVSFVFMAVAYFAGMKLIGDIGIPADSILKAMVSLPALKAFLLSLTEEQLLKLNAWNLLLFFAMGLTYFVIMFYSPALFFKEKNPFKALFLSLKDLFARNFFKNLGLYFILFSSYFLLSILSTVFGMNVVMHFVFTLLNFYYLVFVAVLVYNYYYTNFVKIGSNVDKLA